MISGNGKLVVIGFKEGQLQVWYVDCHCLCIMTHEQCVYVCVCVCVKNVLGDSLTCTVMYSIISFYRILVCNGFQDFKLMSAHIPRADENVSD